MTRDEATDMRVLADYLDHDWMAPGARFAFIRLCEAATAALTEPAPPAPPKPEPSTGDSRP